LFRRSAIHLPADRDLIVKKPRYCLHPGEIRSTSDGQFHHLDASDLARLYGVDMSECVIAKPIRAFDRAASYRSDPYEDLIQLRPRREGDYNLFTLYWLDGRRHVIPGTDVPDAMTKAGFGGGSVDALDFHAAGDDRDYQWDTAAHSWKHVTPL